MDLASAALNECRRDKRLRRRARALACVCKRIRNDREFRCWNLIPIGRGQGALPIAPRHAFGFAVAPAKGAPSGEMLALIAMERPTAARCGTRMRLRAFEYVIAPITLPPPGSQSHLFSLAVPAMLYSQSVAPITIASGFRVAALAWESGLDQRAAATKSAATASLAAEAVEPVELVQSALPIDLPVPSEASLETTTWSPEPAEPTGRVRRRFRIRAGFDLEVQRKLGQEAVTPEIDWLESNSASGVPIELTMPPGATLSEYEKRLAQATNEVRFLGQIQMPKEQVNMLIQLIAGEFARCENRRDCAFRLARDYRCAVTYALVHVTAQDYSEGKLWAAVAARLGVDIPAARLLAPALESCKKAFSLACCRVDRGQRYVTQMLFQMGIPDSCMPEFIEYVWKRFARHGITDSRSVVTRFREDIKREYFRDRQLAAEYGTIQQSGAHYSLTKPVIDFLMHGGEWAEQWVAITARFLGAPAGLPILLRGRPPQRLMLALEQDSSHRRLLRMPDGTGEGSGAGTGGSLVPAKHCGGIGDSVSASAELSLDIKRSALVVDVGEQRLRGDFGSALEMVLKRTGCSGDGEEVIQRKQLEARRIAGGAMALPAAMDLTTLEGQLRLDVECGGLVLVSCPIPSMLLADPCMVFSSTGRLIKHDVLEGSTVWLLLRSGAEVYPEPAVKMRIPALGVGTHELAWIDLQECRDNTLRIVSGPDERCFGLRPQIVDDEVAICGGDRAAGVFCGRRPVYSGALPRLQLRAAEAGDSPSWSMLQGLKLVVKTLDDGISVEQVLEQGVEESVLCNSTLDLDDLMTRLGISDDRPLKAELIWSDPYGMARQLALARMPYLVADFDEKILVPKTGQVFECEVVSSPGWLLEPDPPATVTERYEETTCIQSPADADVILARMVSGDETLPIAIELPTVRWRLEGSGGDDRGPWRSSAVDCWLEDIQNQTTRALSVVIAAPAVRSLQLEAGEVVASVCIADGDRAVSFDLGRFVEIIRRGGPKASLHLALLDSRSSVVARVHVAIVHTEWVPESPDGFIMEGGERKQIRIAWAGVAPRRRMNATLHAAWAPWAPALKALVEPGSHECAFELGTPALAGPYVIRIVDEDALLWAQAGVSGSHPAAELGAVPVWVSDDLPQVRTLEIRRKGIELHCSGSVHPANVGGNLFGIVMRDRCELEKIPVGFSADGRFEFAVDDLTRDASVIGVCAGGTANVYRFAAVGPCRQALQLLTRSSVAQWLSRSRQAGGGVIISVSGDRFESAKLTSEQSRRVLESLSSETGHVRLSLGTPFYTGRAELQVLSGFESDFQLTLQDMLCRCTDENCQYPREVITQQVWHLNHAPKCKGLDPVPQHIRVHLGVEYDLERLVRQPGARFSASLPYLGVVADSAFRPLDCQPSLADSEGELAEAMVQAYITLCTSLAEHAESEEGFAW
ncbi:MAG: hypothetical protein VB144_14435 [Clostridia bacterium]|nr:hypothetical protein [Clostridia bacterium]